MGFVRNDPSGNKIGIRRSPIYPGTCTGDTIAPGVVVSVSSKAYTAHVDANGDSSAINWYQLTDGRGWIHDHCPSKPGERSLAYQHRDRNSNSSSPLSSR